jgi:hypothetical protein|tara:strand:+ start:165 stop:398 length:234 start_codon:yes stop_codon:yes gene_type:complete
MKRGRTKAYIYPTVLVFKTSNRSNARKKMKVYKTKNIDEIIDQLEESKLPGFPKNGVVLDLGIGESFIEKYKNKHKL